MKIQKFLHSCLLVEEGNTRILFDPGLYSFIENRVRPEMLNDIDAVLITHEHNDHADPESLIVILKNNSKASVYGNRDVSEILGKNNIIVLPFEDGEKKIGEINIQAVFAQHATILSSAPKNTAYIINKKILVTGDSFDEHLEKLKGIEILALPIMAPWLRAVDAVAFAEALKVKTVIPVHDGFARDFFLERQYENFKQVFNKTGIQFHPLKPGETLEV